MPAPGDPRRVVLVTGAARGIGRAIAERFLADDWIAAVNDVDGSGLERTVGELTGRGLPVAGYQGDVGDRLQMERVVADVIRTHGRLDALIVNAGVIRFAPLVEYPPADFEETVRVNLIGAFHCVQVVARHWIESNQPGAVVVVTSASGHQARPGHSAYGASKAGLEMLAKVAAMELAPHRIRVNCVAPGGPILTEFVAPLTETPGWDERIKSVVPLGRMGDPEEVAEVVFFLAGAGASYVTGASVAVDGGVTLGRP